MGPAAGGFFYPPPGQGAMGGYYDPSGFFPMPMMGPSGSSGLFLPPQLMGMEPGPASGGPPSGAAAGVRLVPRSIHRACTWSTARVCTVRTLSGS